MDMLEVSLRLTGSMEEESDWCFGGGGEESFHQVNTLIQLLRQKETRLQRLAQLLLAGLLLLISVTVALLLLGVFGRYPQSNVHNDYHSPGTSSKQQQLKTPEKPSALLTAISNYSEEEEHLKWEHKSGNAYCDGGFRYSNGYLVVPRNGYYTVYLQVTYENYKPISCFKNVLILESEVHIFQQSYPMNVTLMSMVESVNCSWKTWRKSLYTSAVFHLETNDRMWVTSSHPEFIAQKEQQVFFGAKFESEKPNTAGIT